VRDLARRPNVTVKLSGLVTESHWKRWGTGDLAPYADVVLGGTATRVYGLSYGPHA
jgi:L-fuconolactonase